MDKTAQQLIDQLEASDKTKYLYREGNYFGRHVVVTVLIIDPEQRENQDSRSLTPL